MSEDEDDIDNDGDGEFDYFRVNNIIYGAVSGFLAQRWKTTSSDFFLLILWTTTKRSKGIENQTMMRDISLF